jgi:hypothetical protein
MMLYGSPDHAGRDYLRLLSLESPQGIDFLDRSVVCAACGGGPAMVKGGAIKRDADGNIRFNRQGEAKRDAIFTLCLTCGAAWEGIEVCALRGGRAERCRDPEAGFRLEDRERLRLLRPVFGADARPGRMTEADWKFHRISYFYYLDTRFGTYALVAEIGADLLPSAPRTWSIGSVRLAISKMRDLAEERLCRAGVNGTSMLAKCDEGGTWSATAALPA